MKNEKRQTFEGAVKYMSLSPHGDPEGLVLDNGAFLKIPPHSIIEKDDLRIGTLVSGDGERITESPNPVFHHVRLRSGTRLLSDDSVSREDKEALKEKHHQEMKARSHPRDESMTLTGTVVAVAKKPKGEIDRIVLADGTSIHIPKEVELPNVNFEIGSAIRVKGKARLFKANYFLKAETIKFL